MPCELPLICSGCLLVVLGETGECWETSQLQLTRGGWIPLQSAIHRFGSVIHSWIPRIVILGMNFTSLQPSSGRHPNTWVAFKLQAGFGPCFKVIVLTQGGRLELSSWLSGGDKVSWREGAECAGAGNPQHPMAVSVPKTLPVILFSPKLFL